MLKLVLISGDSSLTGAPIHVLQLARGLKKKFNVLIIAPAGQLSQAAKKEKIATQEIAMGGPLDRAAVGRIREALEEFKPDIIHFHGVRGGWLGRMAARNLEKTKKIYTEHLWTDKYHLSNPVYEKFQLTGLKYLEKYTDAIVAVSKSVEDFLHQQKFRSPIFLIENGIRDEFMQKDQIKKPAGVPIIIGSVGSLNRVKNYPNMLRAIAQIKRERPELRLAYQVIGEGPDKKSLEKLVSKLRIKNMVHFIGRVDSVSDQMRHFAIFLNASRSESFGLAVGEAMAVGIPVIASDLKPLHDLVGDTGLFVDPRSPQDIAKKLLKLIGNDSLRAQLGDRGKQRIKNSFSEEEMVKKTIEVYKKVLEENNKK